MSVVQVEQLRKVYGDVVAVDDVSFTVEAGEVFGILGPNGAGKTTTVECIQGLRRPDGGRVRVLGLDPQRDGAEVRRRVGAQLQDSRLQAKLQVGEALELYASFHDAPADPQELLELLGLAGSRRVRYHALSGGQKQRLSIALALVGCPQVAVLDELTTGLDPRARRDTWTLIERIRDSGVTILLVTHVMEEAERLCDRLAVIDAGRVVAIDTPSGLVADVVDTQLLRFTPSRPVELDRLRALGSVTRVERVGDQLAVTGEGTVVQDVTSLLARDGVIAGELRVEQRTLDDAFVALTGRTLDRTPTAAPGDDQEVVR